MINLILSLIKKLIPQKLFQTLQPIYHKTLALLSAFFYGYPSKKIIVIGVTGTSGKSSTCYFLAQILESAGFKVGMTTTTLFKIGNHEWLNDKKMTMLGRFQLQKLLQQMAKENCEVAIIETSSQGIEQFRHLGINYDILVLTNLYPEHIEAHGGFENYKRAKGKLFEYLITQKHKNTKTQKQIIKKTIIINGDDENAGYFLGFKADRKIAYGVNNELRIMNYGNEKTEILNASAPEKENGVIKTIIHNSLFIIHLLGDYNLYNVLAAIAVAQALNIDLEIIRATAAQLKPLPGRLEFIENNSGITIIVDYAFEPRALEKLYETIKNVPHQKIIHILGSAGGGRDKARRPMLGKIAAKNADIVIITNEDPYDEEPQKIIEQVADGVNVTPTFPPERQPARQPARQGHSGGKSFGRAGRSDKDVTQAFRPEKSLYKILDRREAIRKALSLAEKGDLILITGKGAEQAICVKGGQMIPWDDRKVVREEIKQLTKNS